MEIDVPTLDAYGTEVLGVNNLDDLLGIFNDHTGMHGFEVIPVATTAPEPASLHCSARDWPG